MIVLPLILGIGIDDGVHVVHDFRRQEGRYRLSSSTATAVLITSLTTMMGFGSLMLAEIDPETGEEQPAPRELLRLAIPRRTYTQSHMDYLLEVTEAVWARRAEVPGIAIEEAPRVLRHFAARFRRPVPELPRAARVTQVPPAGPPTLV